MPLNPYAAPADTPAPQDDPGQFDLASRAARLAGAVIDTLVLVFAGIPAEALSAGLAERARPFFLLAAPVLQAVLIARSGQSVGKILTKTRIVLANGRPAGLFTGYVLRSLAIVVVVLLPFILRQAGPIRTFPLSPSQFFWLVFLVDALPILGAQRRCLHDRLAGTFVVAVRSERPRDDVEPPRKRRKKRQRRAPTATQP
jgi:uncharacterized RDD family membrane protein YckC